MSTRCPGLKLIHGTPPPPPYLQFQLPNVDGCKGPGLPGQPLGRHSSCALTSQELAERHQPEWDADPHEEHIWNKPDPVSAEGALEAINP